MLDQPLLAKLDPMQRELASQGLMSLANSGILPMQIAALELRFINNFESKEDFELIEEIKITRELIKGLRQLQAIGESIIKEKRNA